MRLQTEIEMEFRGRQQLPLSKLFGSGFTEAFGGMEGGTPEGHLLPGGSTYVAALVGSQPWEVGGTGGGGRGQTPGNCRLLLYCINVPEWLWLREDSVSLMLNHVRSLERVTWLFSGDAVRFG